jgi:hypothetical protein
MKSEPMKSELTPQQKIMRAAKRGTGLRLTADEVHALSLDDAIRQCALNDEYDPDGNLA